MKMIKVQIKNAIFDVEEYLTINNFSEYEGNFLMDIFMIKEK